MIDSPQPVVSVSATGPHSELPYGDSEVFQLLFAHNPLPMWVYDADNQEFLEVNDAAVMQYGYSREEFRHMRITDIGPPEDLPRLLDDQRKERSDLQFSGEWRHQYSGEWRHQYKDGQIIDVEVTSHTIPAGGRKAVLVVAQNVSQRKRLEEELRQAQKMEAVGLLAGGIVHDFNNLLGVIIGFNELVLDDISLTDPLRLKAEGIKEAANRAAALTRQLLAFSRKQLPQAKVLNLNSVVGEVERMLERVIGEDIAIRCLLPARLGQVKADPGQIEQIIMNLAVNARDAMPDGGTLTIQTANVDLNKSYARQHHNVSPGEYVLLTMTDSGIGMDAVTQARIFEPFFTTKGPGKGTGLGLATVYGIVTQSGGFIWVYSEQGKGTTFKILFPRVDETRQTAEPSEVPATLLKGSETILLVEDDASVRELIQEALEYAGYTVLVAAGGTEALAVAGQCTAPIHLLLTDVVMRGAPGPELAKRLTLIRPETRVLYMSGYTDDAIAHYGVLEPGTHLIEKPFTKSVLLQKVREVLNT